MNVVYNSEFKRKLRAGFIGCGGHAFRNIYPAFAYLPIDLAAVCDLDRSKAELTAHQFGARQAYDNHIEMLNREKPEVVFVVAGYDEQGRCRYPALACDAMNHGASVWVEKPPVNDLADCDMIRKTMAETEKKFAVGFKKMFSPVNTRLKEITTLPDFGAIATISLRYPQYIPTVEELTTTRPGDPKTGHRIGFLDHLCHPVSLLQFLGGRTKSLSYARASNGAGFAHLSMKSGVQACIHFTAGQSGTSVLERIEVTGAGSNAVVENNIRLTWYRPVQDPALRSYGRASDFTGAVGDAPIVWEPEFSLGNLYNKNICLLGYYNELNYFCEAVLHDAPLAFGTLDDAEEGIRMFDAFKKGPGTTVEI